MGGFEALTLVGVEPILKYHPHNAEILISCSESYRETVSGGQFDWGGFLLKSNGGVQRLSQLRRQWSVERKGIRELNCETYKSSRCESRT